MKWVERYFRHRFAWLFVSLLLTIGVNPVLNVLLPFDPIELLLAVNLLAAIATAARERGVRVLAVLGAVFVVARLLALALGSDVLAPLSRVAWIAAIVLAAAATARYALQKGPVDTSHVFAALDTYLLVGLIFAMGYSALDYAWPNSFGDPLASDLDLGRSVYFSFVTLATLGYGDIVPASEIARGVAVLEAVIGQLYLAVLVARLISLYSQQGRS